jgi:ABC-type uncharacterized transport system involved in gliding motility auxiliary subunit
MRPILKHSPRLSGGGRESLKHRRRWRWLFGLNTVTALLLAAATAVMLNYLASRHFARWDLSRSKYFRLSDRTRSILDHLEHEVEVIVFFQPGHDLYTDIDHLLREYQYAGRRVKVVRVDPDRDLGRAEELARKYQVTHANTVVFSSEGRIRHVAAEDIAEYDLSPVKEGRRPERIAFRGEQAFSSAIYGITQANRPVVYFLTGHGERAPDDFESGRGYSDLARLIRDDDVEIRSLQFGEVKAIPKDCGALIVAGPKHRLSQPEIDRLQDYLGNQNGRAIFLLDSGVATGLEPLLKSWGVEAGNDQVVDGTRTLSGRELIVNQFGRHPITERLTNIAAVFYLPRSISPAESLSNEAPAADQARVTPLALTTSAGWAETDLDENPMRFDPARDRPGPISVAVAVEKGAIRGDIPVQLSPTQFVVFGDSTFLANGRMASGNADLFLSSLNWLLERDELLAIAPRPVEETRMDLDRRQFRLMGWVVIAGVPGLVAILGLFVGWRRRS